ncbi:MAG TPA: Ig-like domain-containing protein [Polyangiaceae bacterium]|jgi:hypothetical protein
MSSTRPPRITFLLFVALLVAGLAAACGSKGGGDTFAPGSGHDGGVADGTAGDATGSSDGPTLLGDGMAGDSASGPLAIAPANATLAVPYGTQKPTVTFTATAGGVSVPASFTIDLGQIATIGASSGVLTPSGVIGGAAHVTATFGGQSVSTTITVTVTMQQNGAPTGYDAGGGTGGNGGVGGNGPGGQVGASGQAVLNGTPTTDTGLAWLYPYDNTVWPQGLLAPLLQWTPGAVGSYDAVRIHLSEPGFDYEGYFAANGSPFNDHPILQQTWDALSYSNQGGKVAVTLVFSSGGKAYGPLTETWSIAQGTLTGTVYYNSYGTALATNYCAAASWNGGAQICFGGATLAIKHGLTSPVLVAGTNSPPGDDSGCRVCHSVAAQGAQLVTQHGDNYAQASAYALAAPVTETVMGPASGLFAFPAVSPDGTLLFNNCGPLPGTSPAATSALYSIPSGNAVATTGLPAGLAASTPVFSPDGKHIAYGDYGGDKVSLASIDYDPATNTFSNQQNLDTPTGGDADVFPAFLPTSDAVIYERELAGSPYGATWSGSKGQLWWVDLKTHTAAELKNVNGESYLPTTVGTNHATDWDLQYEPTVNPVVSGGYAWVVFTSRRLYGNVATQDPWLSDPRNYDPASAPNTKKLWVAAIDLNAPPGTDPSHPAFYLPAQELLAGNSRGYWVVDPCEQDGISCLTGDQCCSGYCGPTEAGLVCGKPPAGCVSLTNKCTQNSDCCGSSTGIECIDGFCAMPTPQ